MPGCSYETGEVARSPVSLRELDDLKISAGFKEEEQRHLRLAGEVLADQTRQIVDHWRGRIIAGIPQPRATLSLARRVRDSDYQQEIALRHTRSKQNETIKPCLAAKRHSDEQVDKMHGAWCKSIEIQLALWVAPYADTRQAPNEW
jgi:hypothetical protein